MNLSLVDTASIYRRFLATSDAAAREAIYRMELLAPFAGILRVFGGVGGCALRMSARICA
jgi:hypothetical protein